MIQKRRPRTSDESTPPHNWKATLNTRFIPGRVRIQTDLDGFALGRGRPSKLVRHEKNLALEMTHSRAASATPTWQVTSEDFEQRNLKKALEKTFINASQK